MLQIEIGVILGLHDGVINPGTGNGNPAHQVAVLSVHIRILFKGCEFFRLLDGVIGKLQRGQLHIFFDQLGHLVKGFGTLLLVQVFTSQHSPGEKEKGGTKGHPSDHQSAFNFVTHIFTLLYLSCLFFTGRLAALPGLGRFQPLQLGFHR